MERETINLVSPPRTSSIQRPLHERHGIPPEYSEVHSSKHKMYHPEPQSCDGYHNQYSKRSKPSVHDQEPYTGPNHGQATMRPHTRGYESTWMRPQYKAYPSQEIIDLTSSSHQPPFGNAGDLFALTRGYHAATADKYGYVPEANRPTVRNDYHDQTAGARPHAYIPEHDRMYQRRPPPAHEYVPLRR